MKRLRVFNTTGICVLFLVFSSLDTNAAAINFLGQLDAVQVDNSGGIYSGIPIGTNFSGFSGDATAKGKDVYSGVDQLNSVQSPATATPVISGKFSGTWYDPTHDGEGYLIEILDGNSAVVYWFTYDKNGDQVWIFGVGAITGNTISITDALITNGGVFGPGFNPASVVRNTWGSLSFTFSDCNNAVVNYDGPPEFGSGILILQRLTSIAGLSCDQAPQVENQDAGFGRITGLWYDPTHDGEGYLIEILDENRALIYWFTYDSNGNQAWIIGVGTVNGRTITIESSIFTIGGVFGPDFDPNSVERLEWGRITFGFASCSLGTVRYESSAGFGSGTLELIRLTSIDDYICNILPNIDSTFDAKPMLSVVATSLDFGEVLIGNSRDLSFTVTNDGDATLTGSSAVSPPFSIFSEDSFSLAVGESQLVTIRFSPTSMGSFNGSVSISSNGGSASVSLFGIGDNNGCVDVSGNWRASETVTVTCVANGENETAMESGIGTVFIDQNGCDISYTPPMTNTPRTGTLDGNKIELSGSFVIPLISDVTFNNNIVLVKGLVEGNQIILNGTGNADGRGGGISFSCNGNSSATLTKLNSN